MRQDIVDAICAAGPEMVRHYLDKLSKMVDRAIARNQDMVALPLLELRVHLQADAAGLGLVT